MKADQLTQFIEQQNFDLALATRNAITEHLKLLTSKGKEVFGYCLLTAEEIDIIAPCGVANTVPYSEHIKKYQFFNPDEWLGDSGEWGNTLFSSTWPIVEAHNTRFYDLHDGLDDPFVHDARKIAFITSYHNAYAKLLGQLRNEGVFSPNTFLAVWASDPDDWLWIENTIKKLNSNRVLRNSSYQ